MKIFATALLVVAIAACGKGRAIFNVDAQSFMVGTKKDTIPYGIPPFTTASASTFQKISLPPGFGSSVVDSARITNGNINLMNTAGTGTIGFQLAFGADSVAAAGAAAALTVPATSVSGATTVPVAITGDLGTVANLFAKDALWIRITATGTNSGATPVTGKGVVTALMIRVVLQDKLF